MLINVISDTKWHTDVNVIQRIWVTKNLRLHNKCQSDTLKLMLYMERQVTQKLLLLIECYSDTLKLILCIECQWHRNSYYTLNIIMAH